MAKPQSQKKSKKKVIKKVTKKVTKKRSTKAGSKSVATKSVSGKRISPTVTPAWAMHLSQQLKSVHTQLNTMYDMIEALPTGDTVPSKVETDDTSLFDGMKVNTQASDQLGLDGKNGNGEDKITKEDMVQAMQEVSAKYGNDKVKEIIASFDAQKVSDIKTTDYRHVYAACQTVGEKLVTL